MVFLDVEPLAAKTNSRIHKSYVLYTLLHSLQFIMSLNVLFLPGGTGILKDIASFDWNATVWTSLALWQGLWEQFAWNAHFIWLHWLIWCRVIILISSDCSITIAVIVVTIYRMLSLCLAVWHLIIFSKLQQGRLSLFHRWEAEVRNLKWLWNRTCGLSMTELIKNQISIQSPFP